MELNIQYYWTNDEQDHKSVVKHTGIQLGNNWYLIKGFIGEYDIGDLYTVADAILNFEVDKEEEFVIHCSQYNQIPKDIAEDFWIEVNLPTA